MRRTDDRFTIAEWEEAAQSRADIEFMEFKMKDHCVMAASGVISTGQAEFFVRWSHRGHCYYRSLRLYDFDIKPTHR